MRLRPFAWFFLSLLCFLGALHFWRLGNQWARQAAQTRAATATNQVAQPETAKPRTEAKKTSHRLLSSEGNLNSVSVRKQSEPAPRPRDAHLAYRLSNTTKTLKEMSKSDQAILLENALLDTAEGLPAIPEGLRSKGEPAAFIVQARGTIDKEFRQELAQAGARIVSYIPNNAYLVRAAEAQRLQGLSRVQSVLPYEPYFKLKPGLLAAAVEQQPMPSDLLLNVLVFEDLKKATAESLAQIGARVLNESTSPFGPVLQVRPEPQSLTAIAGLPGVQIVEMARERVRANDLSRARVSVSPNSFGETNYLNLSGKGVMVNINDTGVDTNQPALIGRVFLDPFDINGVGGYDTQGHGTHVAGIIAGDGAQSETVTNASGSSMPPLPKQFRGMAPEATLFSLSVDLDRFVSSTDYYLQVRAASTNALISNNSWHYRNNTDYDLAAASYDAAVRDSIPTRTGSQPLLYVFAAGNRGNGEDNGLGGDSETVQSPATAKNVITVGAIEQVRDITNEVYQCFDEFGNTFCETNSPWETQTDFNNQVAAYSSRGNVGVGIEGDFGRFKPDVVAPGTMVVSTRSTVWNQSAYYNTTNVDANFLARQLVDTNSIHTYSLFIPDNAIEVTIRAEAANVVDIPVYLRYLAAPTLGVYDFRGTNVVRLPQDAPMPAPNTSLFYGIGNPTNLPFYYNLTTTVVLTNSNGNYSEVLSNLNENLGPYYRYESGTSMAAGNVSGVLALMHEFFTLRLGLTNSPALMKALLINGARPTGPIYDIYPQNTMNLQGWGTINLTNSLPGSFSNAVTQPFGPSPLIFFEQNPTNALATGDSVTRQIRVSAAATDRPMRITLAWTDPPGNPSASQKLVNNLDLVVTNLDTGDVYFGNDIPTEGNFNTIWDTNGLPTLDDVNNVENVYLSLPLSTNYTVTVRAKAVNVNAVSAHPDNVVQDYALVISSGNGAIPDALTVVDAPKISSRNDNILSPTNTFAGNPRYSGAMLMNQRVGASSPLLGTNTIPLAGANPTPWGGGADGVLTFGVTNQWRFYILTNINNFTNAAFITFLPPNLSVPRMGVNETEITNASRIEADIDLYVSTDPRLLDLHPVAVAAADKSLRRGGTEFVAYTNAAPQSVYYIGVKAEDQMACQYAFTGIFSQDPFSSQDPEGNTVVNFFPVPAQIPDGSPVSPGGVPILGLAIQEVKVRRATVWNMIEHENMGDLVGNLTHNQVSVILNNHRPAPDLPLRPGPWEFVYDDLPDSELPPSPTTNSVPDFQMGPDGPGSLQDFIGEDGLGVWTLFMVDNALTQTGRVVDLKLVLEPQEVEEGAVREIPPNSFIYDFVDVPPDATNMTICVTGNTAPVELYVLRNRLPSRPIFDHFKLIQPPGSCLSITPFDVPPLTPGRYFIGVFNPNSIAQNVRILVTIDRDFFARPLAVRSPAGSVAIRDDAVTYAYITNNIHLPIYQMDVGLLLNHPRVSDLAITLISPTGTRVMLFEDRGAWTTDGLGILGAQTNSAGEPGMLVTNLTFFSTNTFENTQPGYFAPGAVFEGWNVLSNYALVVPDYRDIAQVNNILIPDNSSVSNLLSTTNPTTYAIGFKATHAPFIVGTVGWWPLDETGEDIFGGLDGFFSGEIIPFTGKVGESFFGNGVRSSVTVPACPALDVGPGRGFSVEGWFFPVDAARPAPLIEWANVTNYASPGVQLWLMGDTNNPPGTVFANVWDTNGLPHPIQTPGLTVTNLGWQHIALTYDAASSLARIYVNGIVAASQVLIGPMVPQTSHDLYFGFHGGFTNLDLSLLGGVDEVGLYDRALAQNELMSIVKAGANGKYSPLTLTNPVAVQVTLLNPAPVSFIFTNGLAWANGPAWEWNRIEFTTTSTNPTPVIFTALDPNLAIDDITLSGITTNVLSGYFHFSENTNQALLPVKYAPTPYAVSNFPPTLIFTNDFDATTQGVYEAGSTIDGMPGRPQDGSRPWNVLTGPVTVCSNQYFGGFLTNWLVLATNQIQTVLPTIGGRRYELKYTVRGPGAVGWWNGDVNPYSRRAQDLIAGNNGAFLRPATNTTFAEVGATSMAFGVVSNIAGKIELGDPEILRLTNSLTIEAWIHPTNLPPGIGQILFRGDMQRCLDPYYVAMTSDGRLQFHVENDSGFGCGADVLTRPGMLGLNSWQHVAAVFEENVPYRGNPAIRTNEMRLYYNGVAVATNWTSQRPYRDMNEAYSPGMSIGNRSRSDVSQPFLGYIDELSIYARALTPVEIAAIAANGTAGKYDAGAPPSQSLAKVNVYVDNLLVDVGRGENSTWTTRTVKFTATSANSVLRLQGLLPGTIIDGVALTEMPGEMRYLPEQTLKLMEGQDAYGLWTLEIWDTRAGGFTNLDASLISWELTFVQLPNNPPPPVSLTHGIAYTNTLRAFGYQNFIVQVPQWASFATNRLLVATNLQANLPATVGVLYDRTNFPVTINNALVWPPANRASVTLDTNQLTSQYIVPGQAYYLTVTNPSPIAATFGVDVWFDITTLTNCQAVTNFVGPAGIPRYFQFDVPDEDILPGDPRTVSFWLSGVQSNVTVVLSQHLPLPDLARHDYISEWPCTNGEVIMLVTNTTPFPIQTNRWYVGVFNTTATNVAFTVEACYATNSPLVISLTNDIAFVVPTPTNEFAAPPGAPRRVFFEFEITNSASAVLFEMYNLSANVDLVLQRDTLPTMAPYFRTSYREGTTPEQIVLRPSSEFPDLNGKWYLGVYNNEQTNVAYTLRAVLNDYQGLLISAQPIQTRLTPILVPRGVRVGWNGVEGEAYIVEFSPSIINPTWTAIGPPIIATTPFPYIELPTPNIGNGFYRVSQLGRNFVAVAPISLTLTPGGLIRIAWPLPYFGYTLRFTYDFVIWYDANLPTTIEGFDWVAYDLPSSPPRFYRVSP